MKGNDYVFAALCIAIFMVIVGCHATKEKEKTITHFKREAVARGHAEFVADASGGVEFRWKEIK